MKQHPLCTDSDHSLNVLGLPIPDGLKMEWAALQTRRNFLGRSGKVLGLAAMSSLLGVRACRMTHRRHMLREFVKLPHFAPKAKRAIYLFMSGGPPQMDLLDYKPNLATSTIRTFLIPCEVLSNSPG